MPEFKYSPPGDINDFADHPEASHHLQTWSRLIEERFDQEIATLRRALGQEPLFFSERRHMVDTASPVLSIPWVGFPRIHELRARGDRTKMLMAAERRGEQQLGFADRELTVPVFQAYRDQDEYLEWVLVKQGGRPVKFIFTAESPEYWEFLADADRDILLGLYTGFTGRQVHWSEISWPSDVWASGRFGPVRLYEKGSYNPYNAVNLEECAAHLTHGANTLGAEINLAARATLQRSDRAGNLVTERRRLACCSNFGDPNRNSDPTIGATVNQSVRGGISVTLANPVALYMQSFDSARIADKDGNALPGWWRVLRGREGQVLRAEFGPPHGSALTLDDVRVGNDEPLTSGGQLAELINMVIYARAADLDVAEPPALACSGRCCVAKGSAPAHSELSHVGITAPCRDGWVNAFAEIGGPATGAMSPFARRALAARSVSVEES